MSQPESCTTKGCKAVVNRTFAEVVWTIEGLLVVGMMVVRHFHHSTKGRRLQEAEGLQTVGCRSACDSKALYFPVWLGIARSHPPASSTVSVLPAMVREIERIDFGIQKKGQSHEPIV
jgi:hypothetical protein